MPIPDSVVGGQRRNLYLPTWCKGVSADRGSSGLSRALYSGDMALETRHAITSDVSQSCNNPGLSTATIYKRQNTKATESRGRLSLNGIALEPGRLFTIEVR